MSTLQLFVMGFITILILCLLILGFIKYLDWLNERCYTKTAVTLEILVFAIIGGLVMAFAS